MVDCHKHGYKFSLQWVIIDLGCHSIYPVNSCTDVSFVMMFFGKMLAGPHDFSCCSEANWSHGWLWHTVSGMVGRCWAVCGWPSNWLYTVSSYQLHFRPNWTCWICGRGSRPEVRADWLFILLKQLFYHSSTSLFSFYKQQTTADNATAVVSQFVIQAW